MTPSALFLGSIGVLTETSDLQRRAFNAAFERHGLDWHWDARDYREMLQDQGGRARIAAFAEAQGEEVDVDAIYAAKQGAFGDLVREEGTPARPGVLDIMEAARDLGMQRAFVTSTSAAQVRTVFAGLKEALTPADFAYIGDRAHVEAPKPAPDIYLHAMEVLSLTPADILAVEDTPESAEAALKAGLRVIGFPGEAAQGRAFPDGVAVVEFLSPALLSTGLTRIAAE
ncbi:MAG: HAD-IA family hydrolase [Pseudomonadota bacterium]